MIESNGTVHLSEIVFCTLSPLDFFAYKGLRTEALNSKDSRSFVACSPSELSRTDAEWKNVCTPVFDSDGKGLRSGVGAFYYGEKSKPLLVGSALTELWSRDMSGKTAFYRAIYVRPEFRNMGIGEQIERQQDVWAINNGYEKAVFTVRADKYEWLERQKKTFGAEIRESMELTYANGDHALTYLLQRQFFSARVNRCLALV